MTFISYAQNFEDVILWRALKHIQNGRYIDIGAWEPEIDSVSKAFYDRGWRGVHVEPVPFYAEKLCLARPDEVIIEAAIGLGGGEVEITIVEDTGLSTGQAEIADLHRSLPFAQKKINVPKMSLLELFEAHALGDIHWLKIDVEGMEEEVLRSWESHPSRPWILVLESTLPNSPVQNHIIWESEVVARGYSFAYFDGLNRFYVHEWHPELLSAFGPGPNVFDDFLLSPGNYVMALSNQAREADAANLAVHQLEKIDFLEKKSLALTEQLGQSNAVLAHVQEILEMMENSMSWRSTAIFRRLFRRGT